MRRHIEGVLWLVCLTSFLLAAVAPPHSSLLVVLGLASGVAIVVVGPLHFFRAWKKLKTVPNKREYACWVGFETLCAAAFGVAGLWGMHR